MVARIYIIFTTGMHFMPIFYPSLRPTRGKNNINAGYHELFLKHTIIKPAHIGSTQTENTLSLISNISDLYVN